jgi:hypothetical protein
MAHGQAGAARSGEKRMMRLALFLLGLTLTQAASAAQPVGRLFFTPSERAQLDAMRTQKPSPQQAAAAPPQEPRPTSQTITYSGIVRRNDGRSTLWLNNKPVDEKDALSGFAVTGRVRPDGAVTFQNPETGASINLKVGQRAELQTGRVAESRREKPEPAKKDDAPKADAEISPGDAKSAGGAKGDPARAKGAPEQEPAERKAEAAPPPVATSRDSVSPSDLQQRAKGK